MTIRIPHGHIQLNGQGDDIICHVEGSRWKHDLWSVRKMLLPRQRRARLCHLANDSGITVTVDHEGKVLAKIGYGVRGNLVGRLMGCPHSEIHLMAWLH